MHINNATDIGCIICTNAQFWQMRRARIAYKGFANTQASLALAPGKHFLRSSCREQKLSLQSPLGYDVNEFAGIKARR
jgi:hypothetical protein